MKLLPIIFLGLFWGLTYCAFGQHTTTHIEIRGVYGHPKALWEQGVQLSELGVNAIFVHSGSIDEDMVSKAKADGLKVFAEYATLNGKHYVEDHPEAWAINASGDRVEAADWFMGVCPTEPGFRQYRFKQLRSLLTRFPLDGVWMDYVHWHAQFETPDPILPETCFCSNCLDRFSEHINKEIPGENTELKASWILKHHGEVWRDWRCLIIQEWVIEVKKILHEIRPNALLGLYHCPWDDREFDGARRRILGLDYDLLKDWVDVFSPMVYHARMGKAPEWVANNIQWFCETINTTPGIPPKVWPIVQAHNDPYHISAKEFEIVLKGGMSADASGVMMFTTNSVAEEPDKIAVMKIVYNELK